MNRPTILAITVLLTACGGSQPTTQTSDDVAEAPASEATTSGGSSGRGAIALPNQREVDGNLIGGQPSEADLRAAADAEYRFVVSLRVPTEEGFEAERALVEELGMRFVSIPVAGAAGVTPENAAALDEVLTTGDLPMIIHCASGNRVGALYALRAFAAGRSIEESMEIGRNAGLTRLEATVRERLTALCAADPDRSC